jgi:aromatic-L-amino-acid decarboxylase
VSEATDYHMIPKDFCQFGKMLVDWVADYYENIESIPVLSQVQPGDIRSSPPSP